MRSRANINKHPVHPMLIPFPIAFLIGTLVADLVANFSGARDASLIGYYLAIAGVLSGLAAAVPGMIDYVESVPPASTGKRYATLHMLMNVAVLVLFAAAWFMKGSEMTPPAHTPLILEIIGTVLLGISGAIGGDLAYRYQIGIEHKYAEAGEWKELGIAEVHGTSIPVASPDELQVDQMKLIHLRHRRIVLARTEAGYVAFDDHCTHQGGPLSDGVVIRGCVQCPWHGSQFDVKTGHEQAGPATHPVGTYEIRELQDRIEIVLKEQDLEEAA